jgi:hypothetical protein
VINRCPTYYLVGNVAIKSPSHFSFHAYSVHKSFIMNPVVSVLVASDLFKGVGFKLTMLLTKNIENFSTMYGKLIALNTVENV